MDNKGSADRSLGNTTQGQLHGGLTDFVFERKNVTQCMRMLWQRRGRIDGNADNSKALQRSCRERSRECRALPCNDCWILTGRFSNEASRTFRM